MLPLLPVSLAVLARSVYSQTDLYQGKPWTPDTVSPGVADFLERGPKAAYSQRSLHPAPYTVGPKAPYAQHAVSGRPLLRRGGRQEAEDLLPLETHSFVYLAPPPGATSPRPGVETQGDRQPYARGEQDTRADQVSMETMRQTAVEARRPGSRRQRVQEARRRPGKRARASETRARASETRARASETRARAAETGPVPAVRRAPRHKPRPVVPFRERQQQSLVPPRPRTVQHLVKSAMAKSKQGRRVDTSARRESAAEPEDPVTLVNFGDWAAQWDELEEAWYFYNYYTGESTWNKPAELKHLPFHNPGSEQLPGAGLQGPGEGDVTGYSPPVTGDFQLPGPSANSSSQPAPSPSPVRQGSNLASHQPAEGGQLGQGGPGDQAAEGGQPRKKKKKKKVKSGSNFPKPIGFKYLLPTEKKKPAEARKKERKAEKDYGWLDFLGLPKLPKLPSLFGPSREETEAAAPGRPAARGRKVLRRHHLSPGLRGCYTRIHQLLGLC